VTGGPPGLPEGLRARLAGQAATLAALAEGRPREDLDARPRPEEWSARENLAHLARHQVVFLARLARLLAEDQPHLGRYRAEDDAEWPAWQALPVDEVVRRHRETRRGLVAWTDGLTGEGAARVGVHPTFGPMTVAQWLEFFLLHEAHHLYVAVVRLGEARARRGRGADQG
jgi:uncharacterized damage-inducible protein DinB